jgi:CRP-like cAMP-binding protein
MPPDSVDIPRNRLLAALPPQELEELASQLHPVSLSQRQVLYETGAPIEDVYFIQQGVASILTDMADGASIEVGMIGIEGIVGVAALLGATLSSHQAIVQIPGDALRMNAARCKAAFDQGAGVRRLALRFTESMLNLSAQTAACNRLHSIEQRCARWLLMASDRIGADVMPMTHEFLSTMLGVRRAGVTVTAQELQRSGLIRYHRGEVTIRDHDGLAESACECYRIDHDRFERLCWAP